MSYREKKMMAFLAKTLLNVVYGEEISSNDIQQLYNVAVELGAFELDVQEFRW